MISKQTIICLILFAFIASAFQTTDSATSNCDQQTICSQVDLSLYNYTNAIIRSGYLTIPSKPKSALGFTFYGKTGVTNPNDLNSFPTILWLGGGPGMSTQMNNLQEVGPLKLEKVFSLSVKKNLYSWANNYNLLFIDQPIGTGVSCADKDSQIPQSMNSVIQDLYEGLYQLYKDKKGCFSSAQLNISPNSPLFIFGQSYGGKYAPALANLLLEKAKTSQGFLFGLKGIAIGDGFTSPMQIFSQVSNHGFHIGLLNYEERIKTQKMLFKTYFHMDENNWAGMMNDFFATMDQIHAFSGVSYYNIQKTKIQPPLISEYFKDSNMLDLYKFNKTRTFESLSPKVIQALASDFMKSQVQDFENVLKKIPILVYQGQNDLIVSPPGTLRWLEKVDYENSNDFVSKSLEPWKVNGELLGFGKSSGNLFYKMILNAGHFVPGDQPKAAYLMAQQFINAHK